MSAFLEDFSLMISLKVASYNTHKIKGILVTEKDLIILQESIEKLSFIIHDSEILDIPIPNNILKEILQSLIDMLGNLDKLDK